MFLLGRVLLWVGAMATFPGGYPRDYDDGQTVLVTADKMASPRSPISYDYYYLPQCPVPADLKSQQALPRMNLGQILKGDSFELTAYSVHMGLDQKCTTMCEVEWSVEDIQKASNLTELGYMVSLSADELPAAVVLGTKGSEIDKDHTYHIEASGYPLGDLFANSMHVANHLYMTFYYHITPSGKKRVVGFEVLPASVKSCASLDTGGADNSFEIVVTSTAPVTVPFTYSVVWKESDIAWATRWDVYLRTGRDNVQIHWFSLVDSLLVVLILSTICTVILCRTVLQDISRYNDLNDPEDLDSDTGWKLLHSDVFRRPWGSRLLAALVGSGIQMAAMVAVVIVGVALGILSPANRGSIGQAIVSLFALFGIPAGYCAARLNRVFLINEVSNARSLMVTGVTAVFFPGVIFLGYLLSSFIIWTAGGASPPVSTVCLLGFLWLGVSVPLTCGGAYWGYKAPMEDLPCRVNRLPRQVPTMPFWHRGMFLAFASGLPIVSVGVTEIRSLMISMVFHHFYFMFGFVFLSFFMMILAAVLLSIITTYMTLVRENWKWWWPAFFSGASTGLYAAFVSLSLVSEVTSNGLGVLFVNLINVAIVCSSLSLLLGSICVLSSLWFVKSIYSSIRLD